MFECIKFIFKIIADFIHMLFTIDIGNNMSLGMLVCIISIFFPAVLSVFNFFKNSDDFEFGEMLSKRRGDK